MSDKVQGRIRKRLWLVLAAVVVVLAVLLVPPLVSIGRYKASITRLMSASLGRPVRLSSVSLRLLPWPGFELSDLTVSEDPAYGAEPVLHANSVTASFRLLALWRGKLEISSISMDEASLNLVRAPDGRWNFDPVLHTAAGNRAAAGRRPLHLPYLEATNSRIDFKNGVEKLPFSLLNTDLSFWQESSGEWRLRLRGEPARTDLPQEGSDTGTVRLEASLQPASELRQMPVHVDLEWREAQLGQLTRLMIGSDPGWRGDLTAEFHLDGTADAAQMNAQLSATGVHRAEFAPAEPLDFDAHCALLYHYSTRSVEKLACDSPLGNGTIHLAGELPGNAPPSLTIELKQIAVQAALDALRTVRSGIAPGLAAAGTLSGKIAYAEAAPLATAAPGAPRPHRTAMAGKQAPAPPVTGGFVVEGLALSGDGLDQPIHFPRLTIEPEMPTRGTSGPPSQPPALAASAAVPLGGAQPMTVSVRLALDSYKVALHGQASLARARELAAVAGLGDPAGLGALAGEPMAVDLTAEGPWVPAERNPFAPQTVLPPTPAAQSAPQPSDDWLMGTVTLHNANWKVDYLANHVLLSQAVLHIISYGDTGSLRWDPVAFAYGPVKGTAALTMPLGCAAPDPCLPQFQIQLGDVDAGAVQDAFLGARERGTLLTTLLERLRATSAPVWPRMAGTVQADSLVLGPVTLHAASATLRIEPATVEISSLNAALLGGQLTATGSVSIPQSDTAQPAYSLQAQCTRLSPVAVGALLGQRWSGAALDLAGKLDLGGYTSKDLASSATGTLHFDWSHGVATGASGPAHPVLLRFDRWTGDATIHNGLITLAQNHAQQLGRTSAVQGTVTLATPVKFVLTQPDAAKPR